MFGTLGDNDKTLSIHINTPHQQGPLGLPAVYSTPEVPAAIKGFVQFTCTSDTKGKDIAVDFRAKATSHWSKQYGETRVTFKGKHVLFQRSWAIELDHPKPGMIKAGSSRHEFQVQLDPGMPSSVKGQHGWLRYRFNITLERSFPNRNIHIVQDVWVFSTCIRIPDQLADPPLPKDFPGLWDGCLPYTCSIDSDVIAQGQVVPLTVKFEPFLHGTGLHGQELVIVSATVKLKQYQQLFSRRGSDQSKKELVELQVNHGWPVDKNGWERTLMVLVPDAPILSTTIHTNVVIKTHRLKLLMSIRTSTQTDKQAKEFRVEMPVRITAPRPPEERRLGRTGSSSDAALGSSSTMAATTITAVAAAPPPYIHGASAPPAEKISSAPSFASSSSPSSFSSSSCSSASPFDSATATIALNQQEQLPMYLDEKTMDDSIEKQRHLHEM